LDIVTKHPCANGFGPYQAVPQGGGPRMLEDYGAAAVAIKVTHGSDAGVAIVAHHPMSPILKEGQTPPL
jgi:hypothetical protein